jgi:T5SS/PEP-CTERM-associated repeat protein
MNKVTRLPHFCLKPSPLLLTCVLLCLQGGLSTSPAQLVADGATAIINGTSTNLIGDLVVGTNGSFTTLIITNTGVVTNSGNGIIGQNPSATTNRVTVTGPNSRWSMGGNLELGYYGVYNQLIVTNGGRVENIYGNMGFNPGSIGNSAVVAGVNSLWTNRETVNVGNSSGFCRVVVTNGGTVGAGFLQIGNSGPSNQLTVAGGGKIISAGGRLGSTPSSGANVAVITGSGSQWNSTSGLEVGTSGSFNQLFLTNGGKIISGGAYVGANALQSGSGNSNLVVIAGGSSWTNNGAPGAVGNLGSFNQLIITNGGVLRNTLGNATLALATSTSSSNNVVSVSGTNSLLSNGGNDAIPEMYVGDAGSQNQLLVSNGGLVQSERLYVGHTPSSSNNLVNLSGGTLTLTNDFGTGLTDVRNGTILLNEGLLRTDVLLLTNGAKSQFSFIGGVLQTGGTTVSNGPTFSVGNTASSSSLQLLGNGVHSFADGLDIANNGRLSGSGTINGLLRILSGGTFALGSTDPAPAMGKIVLNKTPLWQGIIAMKVSKSGTSLTNDQLQVNAPLFYNNWLVVTNVGPDALTAGDRFQLFSSTSTMSGQLSAIYLPPLSAGLTWTNKLLVDGSIQVVPWAGPQLRTDLSGTDLVVEATGGFPGWPYDVLTATNLTSTNWTVLSSDYFDWFGDARTYVGTTTAGPTRFYRLLTHAP